MSDARRRVITSMAALLLLATAACSGSGAEEGSSKGKNPAAAPGGGLALTKEKSPVEIVWAGSTGLVRDAEDKAIHEPYTELTGNTFELVTPASLDKIKAMVRSGQTVWDTAPGGSSLAVANCDTLFEKLDTSLYDPEYLERLPEGQVSPCAIPSYRFAAIFSYNTEAFGSNPPTSIEDFFDTEKFPGKRVVKDEANNGIYEAALVASGVDPDDLYPLDVERAHEQMDKIKDDLILVPTVSALEQALASGEAVMTLAPTGATITSVKIGAPLAPVWDFTSYTIGGYSVIKNAPHEQQAQQVVAFAATREAQITYAATNGVSPADPAIKSREVPYDSVQREFDAFGPDNQGTTRFRDVTWYRDNFSALSESWTKWKIG